DIGFHGAAAKAPGGQVPAYELFLGGSYDNGDARIGLRVKHKVPAKMMPDALRDIISYYKSNRNDGEPFKDFVARVGAETFEPVLSKYKEERPLDRDSIHSYMDWDKTVIYKMERGEGECAI
ncbi:MAG: sulfite reductase, partial [Chloroflexi bacterium]|nr:sulfite reductase [Chloroflexota bacterium]